MGILAFVVFVVTCAAIVLPGLRSDASRRIKIPFSERLRRHAAAFFRGFADDFRWTDPGICRKHRTPMRYAGSSISVSCTGLEAGGGTSGRRFDSLGANSAISASPTTVGTTYRHFANGFGGLTVVCSPRTDDLGCSRVLMSASVHRR